MDVILASGSPRRKELLTQMGIKDFRILVPDVDEHVDTPLPPAQLVEALSRRKAEAVRSQTGDSPLIIAADTVVALDGAILGKPADAQEAVAMLTALSGRTHQVYTGFTVLQGGKAVTSHDVTAVTFRPLTAEEISAYVATEEPMDKAGSYAIQGLGGALVSGIKGDFSNVVGLPVPALSHVLQTQFSVNLNGLP